MALTVLNDARGAAFDPARAFGHAVLEWGRAAAAEEIDAGYGTVLVNADLPTVAEANGVYDASVPDDVDPAAVVADIEATFRSRGATCRRWSLNPVRPTRLAEHLTATGWTPRQQTLFQLAHLHPPSRPPPATASLLPARSAYAAHCRLSADRWPGDPSAVTAAESHLDDPRVDAVVAMADGRAVGSAHLLNAGDVGTVVDLYVAPPDRRRGVGSLLLRSLLDTAARAGHRHMLAGIDARHGDAHRLARDVGFIPVGVWTRFEP